MLVLASHAPRYAKYFQSICCIPSSSYAKRKFCLIKNVHGIHKLHES